MTREQILQAVARGWCSKENENKIVDPILGEAITDEVCKALGIKGDTK